MNTKEFSLSYGWTLIADEASSIYVSVNTPNKFVLLDSDDETMLNISVENTKFQIRNYFYHGNHSVDVTNKTITFLNKTR